MRALCRQGPKWQGNNLGVHLLDLGFVQGGRKGWRVESPLHQGPGGQGCILEVGLLDADFVQGGKKMQFLKAVFCQGPGGQGDDVVRVWEMIL